MAIFITLDGGTTNTRITLVRDGQIVDQCKLSVGAGAARLDKEVQKVAIRDGILAIMQRNGVQHTQVERILASGMITSEYGLCHLPHITAPAGLAQLRAAMQEVTLPEISPIPFVFLRGVRTAGEHFADTDMMRGEETELMGLFDPSYGQCVYVLPGSHSKVIQTDAQGCILHFSTLLSGEMFYALSQHTILGDAVDMSSTELDEAYLLQGYLYAAENGINKAIFKTRVLKNMFGSNALQTSSFFRGVVLCDEIREILRYDAHSVVIGGKAQMRRAIAVILQHLGGRQVICLPDDEVDSSVTRGQLRIYGATAQ